MKAQHNITQIARLLGRDKSTISRELRRNAGCRGYKAKQACELACKRSELSRNASTLAPWVKEQTGALLRLQWCPEQIAGKLPVSHESLYLHVYADKAYGGTLWNNLGCQRQKRKRYASGRDRRGQIPNRRPLSERPAHIDKRLQVGHWEFTTQFRGSFDKLSPVINEKTPLPFERWGWANLLTIFAAIAVSA